MKNVSFMACRYNRRNTVRWSGAVLMSDLVYATNEFAQQHVCDAADDGDEVKYVPRISEIILQNSNNRRVISTPRRHIIVTVRSHWRHQLCCTGAPAPSTSYNIFQLTSEPHKTYHRQLYLVSYYLSIWRRAKSATRGVLSRSGSTTSSSAMTERPRELG